MLKQGSDVYKRQADYINTEMDGASSQSYDNADIVKIDAQQDEYSTCLLYTSRCV